MFVYRHCMISSSPLFTSSLVYPLSCAVLTNTPLIRSSSRSSLPSQAQFPSSLSSYKHWLSPVEAAGIRRWRRRWCIHDVWCVLMSDAVWRLMLGEAYSNGETEVRETITTVGEGEVKVGSTLLSSPTVGRGCCPSVMTKRLRDGFAFIMVLDCPDTHHKYMTEVTWHKMLLCLFWMKRRWALCYFMERFCSFCPLCPFSSLVSVCDQRWSSEVLQKTWGMSALFHKRCKHTNM